MSADEEPAEDLVARRLVMRREVWDELTHIADALREARGIEVTPTDVATIALDAGLADVRKTATPEKKPARKKGGRRGRS